MKAVKQNHKNEILELYPQMENRIHVWNIDAQNPCKNAPRQTYFSASAP